MNGRRAFARRLAAGSCLAAVACLGGCVGTVPQPVFVPVVAPGQVTLYLYRERQAAFPGTMPLAERPLIVVNGKAQGTLPWGGVLRVVVPAGDIAVVAGDGEGSRWAFGRFGYHFDAPADAVRYLRLEILEKVPDEVSPGLIRRNWVSRFRETSLTEAAPQLGATPP